MVPAGAGIDDLGKRIRGRRQAGGRTLATVADAAGMSVSHLSAIESGGNLPSLPVLARIARALEVSMADLLRTPGEHAVVTGRVDESAGAQRIADPRMRLDVVVLRASSSEHGAAPVDARSSVLVHVREGALIVDIGPRAHELGAGDTLHASHPGTLGWRTGSGSSCVAVWVGVRSAAQL